MGAILLDTQNRPRYTGSVYTECSSVTFHSRPIYAGTTCYGGRLHKSVHAEEVRHEAKAKMLSAFVRHLHERMRYDDATG